MFKAGQRFALPIFLLFAYNYTAWLIIAYIPVYFNQVGFPDFQIGVFISAFPLSSLILTVPFGFFSDRVSPKKLVTSGLVIFSLFLLGLRYASTFWTFFPLFILGGIGNSVSRISINTIYFKSLGGKRRGVKLGFYDGLGVLGYGLGPLTGGYLLEKFDMTILFGIAFLMLIPVIISSLLLEHIEPVKFRLGQYWKDISQKETLVLVAITFVMALHFGVEETSLSLFLKNYIKLSWVSIGYIFFFSGLAISLLAIVSGLIQDKVTAKGRSLSSFLYLGMFLSGLFNISLLFTSTFGTVLLVRFLHVVGDSIFMVFRDTTASNLFLAERIGGNLGFIQTALTLGTFTGALISGSIPGYLYPFVFAGSLAILSIPFARAAKPSF